MSDLPGPRGLAQLRWMWRLGRDIFRALHDIHTAFGEVSMVGIGRYRGVYLYGAAATRELFAQGPPTVSWHDSMAPLIPVVGETAIVVSDGDDHTRRRGVVQPAFARRRLDDTVALMSEEATASFAAWRPGSSHDAYEELRAAIRRIVVRALFGDDLGDRADELGDRFEDAMAYVNRPFRRRFDHDWPGTPYRRAMRARRAVDEIVYGEIARRRAAGGHDGRDDLLAALLHAQEVDGSLRDVEVRDQVVSLIAAGYDTTSAAAGWLVQFLGRDDAARDQLTEEVATVVGAGPIEPIHLTRMPWLNGVVSEALRLAPPAYVAGRRVERPFEVLGQTVPAGPLVFYVPSVTHRLPELWPDPDAFKPGRWVEGHPDHHDVPVGAWTPFGGGARRCLGFAFAVTELKVLTIELVRATSGAFRAQRPTIPPTGMVAMRPDGPVTITVG